jgi:hypothetical protein
MKAGNSLKTYLIDPGTQNYSHTVPGGTAQSGVRIATDRDVDEKQAAVYTDRADWLDAGGTASNYEVRVSHNSGDALDAGSDSTGVYLALSSNREWYLDALGGVKSCNLTVDIRQTADTSDAISFTVTLAADGAPS